MATRLKWLRSLVKTISVRKLIWPVCGFVEIVHQV